MIETLEHLDRVRDALSANYKLINDIDASPTSDPESSFWNDGEGWQPIGSYLSSFRGTFDGNDHKISGLFIYRPGEDYVGLFGALSGGTVKNLGLEDVNVTAESSIGALAGNFDWPESAVKNSYAAGNVTGSAFSVGGLVGGAGTLTVIENSYFTGKVTGGLQRTGGLLGSGGGAVLNSYAAGRVEGTDDVGGLVGITSADITNSHATGDVTGTGARAGGLVGWFDSGVIKHSYATGAVDGESFVGGLVGQGWGNIKNSYATGDVTGTGGKFDGIGGLAGALAPAVIEVVNSYAAGDVYAPGANHVGGLVGGSYWGVVSIKNSYSTGNVEGGEQVGGLVGWFDSGGIKNSYSTGKVTGENYVGGFAGDVYSDDDVTIEDSFWDVDEDGLATVSGEDNFGATGKTTVEMKDISTFDAAGWDIRISGRDFNEGYPYLSWEINGGSRVWLIFEEPEPEPEPGHPAPPAGFRVDPGDNFILYNHLIWGESETPGISSYRLYVSTGGSSSAMEDGRADDFEFRLLAEFPPDTFEYTHTGLSRIRYYYVITSVDEEGLESNVTSPVYWANPGTGEYGYMEPIPWPGKIIDEPDDDDSSSCFIATAAYGSAMSSEVMSFRDFRDGLLLASWAGNRIVEAYYAASPALAEAIAESGILRRAARLHLAPFAMFAGLIANMN